MTFYYSAVLALDPAGVNPSGLALRLTRSFADVAPKRGRLPAPQWTWNGRVVGCTDWADSLAEFTFQHLARGERLGLVVEQCAYRSYAIARSIGQAVGAVRFGLKALNLLDDPDGSSILRVTPKVWRDWAMPAVKPTGSQTERRRKWKDAARGAVLGLYGIEDDSADADTAEAILQLDWACVQKPRFWKDGKVT